MRAITSVEANNVLMKQWEKLDRGIYNPEYYRMKVFKVNSMIFLGDLRDCIMATLYSSLVF